MRRGIVFAWTVLAASLLVGCGDDAEPSGGEADAGSDAEHDSDAAVECLLQSDDACPEGCTEMTGSPLDEQHQCWLDPVVLGCTDQDGFPDAIGCYVHLDSSTMYITSVWYLQLDESEYRSCTGEEREAMLDVDVDCGNEP